MSRMTYGGTLLKAQQRQHVNLYQKLLLRRSLLKEALPGAAYVPFIGDGDIAVECYADSSVTLVANMRTSKQVTGGRRGCVHHWLLGSPECDSPNTRHTQGECCKCHARVVYTEVVGPNCDIKLPGSTPFRGTYKQSLAEVDA